MEGRIRSLLLSCIYLSIFFLSSNARAEDSTEELDVEQVTKPVIQPDIERMEFDEAKLNSDNFEILLSYGILSIEDFGVNSITNVALIYRATDNFFVGVEAGSSSAGETSADVIYGELSDPILSEDESKYSYYLVNVGYDLFPGESFVTDDTTFNTAFYVIAGAGNTEFAGKDNFTFSWGFGYRVIMNNYLTANFNVRDHTFQRDAYGEDKRTNNIEISLGVGVYF